MIRWLCIALLVGCGKVATNPEKPVEIAKPEKVLTLEQLTKKAQTALEKYFNRDLSDVWKNTTLELVSKEKVNEMCHMEGRNGCYVGPEKDEPGAIYIDKSLPQRGRCEMLIHEFMHAVADRLYGDSDPEHKKYADVFENYALSCCRGGTD